MHYYILAADAEHHVALGPKDPSVWDFFLEKFDSDTPFDQWRPLEMVPVTDHVQNPRKLAGPSDAVNFNLTPICLLSERARAAIGTLLEEYGELLPAYAGDKKFFLLHVTSVVDALDESTSVVERFASGKIMRIVKYSLRGDVIGDRDVFRLPNEKWKVFVSERFVAHVRELGLDGFVFKPV